MREEKVMKKKCLVVLLCSLSLVLGACGQSTGDKYAASATNENAAIDSGVSFDYDESYSEETADMVDEEAKGEEQGADSSNSSEYSQKLIRTYDYSFETTDFEKSLNYINEQVTKNQGYIEESSTYGRSSRSSYMKIRIPEKKAEAFLRDAGQIGEIIQKSESTDDITLNYYDAKSRLDSLKTQHARLLELLEKAESLEDVVALESHLSEVEYQIDRYASKLKVYDKLVDYVTITINLEEVSQIQVVEEDGFWQKIEKGFLRNTENVLDGSLSFVIFIITAIPYLTVLGIFVGIICAVVRTIKKRRAKKHITKINVTENDQGDKE